MPTRTQLFQQTRPHSFLKLKDEFIPAIMDRIAAGETFTAIGRDYGVTSQALTSYLRRRGIQPVRVRVFDDISENPAVNALVHRYRAKAHQRRLEFALDVQTVEHLTSADCHYCGSAPHKVCRNSTRTRTHKYNGIDRVNSDLGYIASNCVTCCQRCNMAKGEMTAQEFAAHVARMFAHMHGGKHAV